MRKTMFLKLILLMTLDKKTGDLIGVSGTCMNPLKLREKRKSAAKKRKELR